MAIILYNDQLADDVYKLTVPYNHDVKPGQFFMLRSWDKYPLLARPISVYDYSDGLVTFLYRIVGEGTKLIKEGKVGEKVKLQGPYGKGFPDVKTDMVAVGGGIGIAPLYYACRKFKLDNPQKNLRVYLGFSNATYCTRDFEKIADEVIVDVGGIITQKVAAKENETFIACGPEIMMESLCQIVPADNRVYISLESHMACGIGACLGCSCTTKEGNKKVCKDGPVFSREVIF